LCMTSEKSNLLAGRPQHFHLFRSDDGEPVVGLVFGVGNVLPVPHVERHSPTGFEWGYGGSGPADCARSMLMALLPYCDLRLVEMVYQDFKWVFLAKLPDGGGIIRVRRILNWYRHHVKRFGADAPVVDALWIVNRKECE